MHPDKSFVVAGLDSDAYWRALADEGRQYALYIHHSSNRRTGSYEVTPGDYAGTLTLNLAPGDYQADWIDPATGTTQGSSVITHDRGMHMITAPHYAVDIALRLKRVTSRSRH